MIAISREEYEKYQVCPSCRWPEANMLLSGCQMHLRSDLPPILERTYYSNLLYAPNPQRRRKLHKGKSTRLRLNTRSKIRTLTLSESGILSIQPIQPTPNR